jgi:hypothetical protein
MPSKQQAKERAPRLRRKRLAGYSTESETAEELNVAVRTLRKWRQLRIGPPWTAVGRLADTRASNRRRVRARPFLAAIRPN